MTMLRLPKERGETELAYITDSERKLLRRRDAVSGKKAPEYSKEGIPVLEGEQQEMREQAAAQKLYDKQKAAGWKTVSDPAGGGGSIWTAPKKKAVTKKKAKVKKKVKVKTTPVTTTNLVFTPYTAATTPVTTTAATTTAATTPVKMPSTKHSIKHGYKKQYFDMASPAKDYSTYVDKYSDLSDAYKQIVSNPNSDQAKYWLPRMTNMSKEAFGKAHAGESMALQSKTYRGATKAIGSKARAVPNKQAAATTTTTPATTATTEPTVTQPTFPGATAAGAGDGITDVSGMSIDAVIDTSKLEKPLLEEIVIAGPKSEVIQERLKDLINTNSPLFRAATTKALQSMNQLGLVNSSIAQEAVMNSILAVAIPIAAADAAAFTAQRMANQNATNTFKAQQNAAYYEAFMTKLTGQINQTLRQLAERSADWRAVLAQRGRIAVTPGMSKSAIQAAMAAVTPPGF
jgi:transcription elongation factor Elf1